MPRKPCAEQNCSKLVELGVTRCAKHERGRRKRYERKRGSSAQRGYGAAWKRIRALHLKANPRCTAPKCRHPASEVHHIKRIRNGGTHDPSNLVSLCRHHHSQWTAQHDGGFGNVAKGEEEVSRRRIVKIEESIIRDLFTTDDSGAWSGAVRVLKGLPKGATYRGCYDEPQYASVCFVFEHKSFDEVEEGAVPLAMHIMMERPNLEVYSALKRLYQYHELTSCPSPYQPPDEEKDKEKDWAILAEVFGLEDGGFGN